MWNVISSNKLLQSKIKQKTYKDHLNKLIKMKSVVKIEAPQKPLFVFIKPKLQMTRRDRLIEIDRQNEILTNKMMNIKNTIYIENQLKSESQQLKSLNQGASQQLKNNIDKQNKRICQKLLRAHSHYPTFQLLKDTHQTQKLRDSISQNARRSISVKSLKTRPQSSSSKFYRSRVSKYDNEGNSNEQINKLFKVKVDSRERPLSAPTIKKPIITRNNKPTQLQDEIEINQCQTNLFSQFNSQNCSPK